MRAAQERRVVILTDPEHAEIGRIAVDVRVAGRTQGRDRIRGAKGTGGIGVDLTPIDGRAVAAAGRVSGQIHRQATRVRALDDLEPCRQLRGRGETSASHGDRLSIGQRPAGDRHRLALCIRMTGEEPHDRTRNQDAKAADLDQRPRSPPFESLDGVFSSHVLPPVFASLHPDARGARQSIAGSPRAWVLHVRQAHSVRPTSGGSVRSSGRARR